MLPGQSPLVDLAMSQIPEPAKKLDNVTLFQIREVFNGFVSGRIPYNTARRLLSPLIGDSAALDRVNSILRIPEQPLPPAMYYRDNSRNLRAKTRPWTPYEDQRLLAGLHRYGLYDWAAVALFVGNGRTKSQCSQRWIRGLDPSINKEQWTKEEDDRLIGLVAHFGEKCWTHIAGELGNRCDVQCRYRYKQLSREEGFSARVKQAHAEILRNPPADPPKSKGHGRDKTAYRGEQQNSTPMMIPPVPMVRPVPDPSIMPYMQVPMQFPTPPLYVAPNLVPTLPQLVPVHPVQSVPALPVPSAPSSVAPVQSVPALPPVASAPSAPIVPLARTVEGGPPIEPPPEPEPSGGMRKQPSLIHFEEQISAQGSGFDWQSVLRPHASDGAFISPMGSMRFDNP